MRISILQKHTSISEGLKERIDRKINKLGKFFDDDLEAIVRLQQEKGGRHVAEITINVDGMVLRAEEVSGDMYMSVDKAIDKLVRQIGRHRARFEKRLRAGAFDGREVGESGEAEPDDGASNALARVKRFKLTPMSVEDAISQMDMLGHSFFLFINADTGITCVVYRRLDGDIGMLEPEGA